MKIAYLAPELPSLSATFVYNEILELESMGTEIIPFSVHLPLSVIQESRIQNLRKRCCFLYAQSKISVLKDNVYLLLTHPVRYFKTFKILCFDMWCVGLLSRTALGLVYRYFFAASLAKQLIKTQCQHIHVHFAHVPTDIAMYAASFSGITFSVTAHANDIFERGWLLKEKVQRSSFFATISEFNQRYLVSQGVDADKVRIIRCGVDAVQFSKRQGFISNQPIKIGAVGRLVEKKGFDSLIKSVALLKNQGQLVELLIAGDGPLQGSLVGLMKDLELLETDVHFLGAMPHKLVADFIKSLDIFVLPCKKDNNGDMDGIPVVLMEAMLSGVPVISTQLSGIPELVINKETGLLAQPENTQELADAISSIIVDTELRGRMVKNAISHVKKEFSLQGNAEKLKNLFSTVVT